MGLSRQEGQEDKGESTKKLSSTALLNLASTDSQEIEISIRRSANKRKEVIALLTTLEDAWRNAVDPYLALNRKDKTTDVREDVTDDLQSAKTADRKGSLKSTLREANFKKKKTRELQQKIFLSFQNLTDEKHEDQLALGEEILKLLPGKTIEEMMSITKKTEQYFRRESLINKSFLSNIKETFTKTESFMTELEDIKKLPCKDKKIEKILNHDLELLEGFLKATKTLLEF